MAITRVLVPLDGSDLAEAALRYLPILKSFGQLQVQLIGVAPHEDDVAEADGEEREARLLDAYLSRQKQQLQDQQYDVNAIVRHGSPAQEIIAEAERLQTDIVLISTHGRSGLQRWRMGSVADKVVRSLSCNALVVSAEAARSGKDGVVQSILTPLDGSELAENALPLAATLARALPAQLHLVRVVTYMPAEETTAAGIARLTRTAEDYLAQKVSEGGLQARTEVVLGTAAESLLSYIEAQSIGLVVLTSHGRGGLLRAALGSVTDRLIGGPAPVLLVRRPSA